MTLPSPRPAAAFWRPAAIYPRRRRSQRRRPRPYTHTRPLPTAYPGPSPLLQFPAAANSSCTSLPRIRLIAACRLINRPAPWHVDPQVCFIAPSVPTSRNEYRPISPGTITGCPTARYCSGTCGLPRPKRSRRAFSVDAELGQLAVDLVLLDLGHVVRHVVDLPQAELVRPRAHHALEALPHPMGYRLPVRPREVRRACHRRQDSPAPRST